MNIVPDILPWMPENGGKEGVLRVTVTHDRESL